MEDHKHPKMEVEKDDKNSQKKEGSKWNASRKKDSNLDSNLSFQDDDIMQGRTTTFSRSRHRAPNMRSYGGDESDELDDFDDDDSIMIPGAIQVGGNDDTYTTTATGWGNDEALQQVASSEHQSEERRDEEIAIDDAYLANDDNGRRRSKRKRANELLEGAILDEKGESASTSTLVCLGCGLVVIISLAVILTVTLTRSGRDSKDSSTSLEVETMTRLPSTGPSTTPSTFPSQITLSPTTSALPTSTPSEIPTTASIELAINDITTLFKNWTCCLDDSTSPQYNAAKWLADEDTLTRFPVNVTNDSEVLALQYRYSLAVFYFATNGDDWDNQCNFLSPVHACDWNCDLSDAVFEQSLHSHFDATEFGYPDITIAEYLFIDNDQKNGVLCGNEYPWENVPSRRNQPVSLFFVFNNLAGVIPIDMIGLPFREYELSFNKIGGNFPFESMYSNMTILGLESNRFDGPIPSSIGQLTDLQYLRMDYNLLRGTLPTELGSLSNLLVIDMSYNLLSGPFPSELDQPWFVEFAGNMFSGSVPASLFANGIRLMDLQDNLLSGTIPHDLPENKELQILGLSRNALAGTLPATIGQLHEMLTLDVRFNGLSGAIPASLSKMTKLQNLGLDGNRFAGRPLDDDSWLWKLPAMSALSLPNNLFSGTLPSQIGDMRNFRIVDLAKNRFSGTIPSSINLLGNLLYLSLYNNSFSGSLQLERSFNSLRYLWLQQNDLTGDLSLQCESAILLLDTGLIDYKANCLDIVCPCCTECCDDDGTCTLNV